MIDSQYSDLEDSLGLTAVGSVAAAAGCTSFVGVGPGGPFRPWGS